MPPRKKASAAKASAAPTSSASARPSRTKQQPSAPAPPSSSSSQDDSEEEDIKPVIRATRGTRASAGGSTPVPTRTTRARESVASISTPAEARPTASRGAKGRVDALKSAGGAGRRTRASESSVVSVMEDEEEEEDEAEEESEEGSEEEEVVQKPARRGAKKVVVASEDEEEEDVKPVIPKKGRGKTAVAASPEPEDEEDEEEAAVEKEDEEEEEYEEEETIAPKKKDNKKVKPSARVISSPAPSHDEDDTAQIASDAEDPAATPVPTTPSKSASIEQNQLPSPSASPPPPVVAPPPPVFVNTAHDLAAAAKAAAERHYESVKEREKEREGKPRLVIHQMVMEDFKSYRGRGVIGPFHKSFSAIVGPNGSGKSNTIDALLFVFGYRATKMRQGKLSELIHNSGSPADTVVEEPVAAPADAEADEYAEAEDEDEDDYDQGGKKKKGKKGKGKKKATVQDEAGLIGSCTVEVWFREIIDLPGGDEFTVVPNSQLVVSRTAYRNNSSRYTINGRASTFTEVTTLLKGRGIDLEHKRFLILQGEVESIAQMKPKGATEHDEGLLEYLEDIIGTSRYKTEIEVAVVEVERLNDARGVQMNRVKLVEREKSALEGRKKEADAFLKDQNELVHNQSALFQVNIHQASINSVVYEEAVTIATTELTEEVEAQAGSRQEVNALQEEFDQLVKDTKDAEKTTNELSKELAVFDKTDVQLQEKKKSTLTKTKKLKKSLADDSHTKSEAETWVRNHTEELQKVRGECDKMESVLEAEEAELDQVRDSLKGKTEVYSTQIESLQTDLQPWAAQIADQQASIDLATNERDLLAEKTNSIKVGIDEAKSTLENLAADDAAKHERLETLEAEKQQVESEVEAARSTLNDMQAEDAKLRTKATVARQKSDEAKASHSASRSQGNVLSSLTKLKEQGRLAGFHGRLGNLGRIDDKYDVAISTACGGLDNLVTDTISVGQACIEHLRKNDLGRANVMCLDRIVARDMSTVQTPENAPRLFDLITVKESKFAPAFFQLLTNTLVANDLDQGKRLAFGGGKRWRVVTLDGQLIDVSGTMSGGGGRPMKGKMSSKIVADEVSPELVAKCEREQSVTVEALRVFVESREKVEATLRSLRKRLPEIELTISKVGMDIKTGGKRREEAERRLADLQSQSKPEAGDVKKISQLDKDVVTLSKGLVQLQKESSSIETKIKALQEKILEVGGVKLRSQQTKVQDLRSRISLANDRLTKSEVGRAKSEKDAIKLGKAIEANNLALKLAEGELEHLTTQISDGAATSSTVRKAVEQSKVVLDEKVEELAEMKKDLDDKVDMITQFKKRELELKQHLGAQQKLLDESKHAVVYWSDKLGDLQLNDIDDDDEEDEEVEGKAPKAENVLHQWTEEEIPGLDVKLLKAKISALEERVARSNLDLSVLKEYARREKEFMQRAADLDAVTQERDAAKKTSDDLRNKRLKEFMEGFGIISMQLKSMYQLITLGGNAELELVDSLDPFSEGVTFSVMPPKKSWKNISNLSGGEKTLSSLALVFALQIFKPTPLYFMDEIDAALDFRNVSIIANYIKERTKGCQFVVVSLRNNMYVVAIAVQRRRHLLTLSVHRFELSSRLIGVYKVANQTRSVAIDNRDLAMVKA